MPTLFYDGVCGFCNWTVQLILKHDRAGSMRFAALQSQTGEAMLAKFPELKGVDSVVIIETDADGKERACSRSTAALRICRYLGGLWRIYLVFHIVPRPLRDACYDLFARYRYRLFGKRESCMVPAPEVRDRFIDTGVG